MEDKEIALRLVELAHQQKPDGDPEEYLKTLVRLWKETLIELPTSEWRPPPHITNF